MEAFLFDSDRKYTTYRSSWGKGNYAIYQYNSYGPTFGGGHDFLSLPSWNPKSLSNNSWTFTNNGEGPLGVNEYTYNSYTLKDLEVYSITAGTREIRDDPSSNITPKIMYGPWISREQQTKIRNLDNNKIVHIVFDDVYTKMVSSDGEEKYYRGSIQEFNPNNWNSYSNTGGGKYLLK
jgi:hypothetical protein